MTARALLAAALSVAIVVLSPFVGAALDGPQGGFILWQLRLPRALCGALVGSTLGLVGAAYQAVFDNPLATPSTVGTTAGASVGALIALTWLPPAWSFGTPLVALAAFAGALLTTLFVSALAASGRARTEDVLLAGVALTFAATALTTALQVQADLAATFRAVRWSLGSVAVVGYRPVAVLLPFVLITHALLLPRAAALQALALGHERAATQGVDVTATRALVLGGGALGVGAAVAWTGPIAFVGLIVPHLVRRTLGASRHVLLPMSSVLGAGFLVAADTLARTALPGRDLPVGALTAALGAPLLLALVTRR